MKKTGTVASLVLIGMMACVAAVAAPGTTANISSAHAGDATPFAMAKSLAQASKTSKASKAKPALEKKKFRYLDMVERKHPSSIRNAVIVYDHVLMRKKACDVHDPASVSECLGRPSV